MIAHDFILDFLYPLPVRIKKMFGNHAIYVDEKIVLATRHHPIKAVDNGIWIATKIIYHSDLKERFPTLQNIETYAIKTWLLLPEDSLFFEERAQKIVELIKQNSNLIGNIPSSRK